MTDLAAILALNQADAQYTSALDMAKLEQMLGVAFRLLTHDTGRAGFLLAMDQASDYASPNFLWFRARLPRFVYIDRIVVAAALRGQGIARRLYEALFAEALAAGHATVCCEVNLIPPNPGSDAFHAALGFTEIGRARVQGGSKTVRYLSRPL